MFTLSPVPTRRPWRSPDSVLGTLALNSLYDKVSELSIGSDIHKRPSPLYAWAKWTGVTVNIARGGLNDPVSLLIGASEEVADKYMARQMSRIEEDNDLDTEENFMIGFDFDEDACASLLIEDIDTLDWVLAEFAELKLACGPP